MALAKVAHTQQQQQQHQQQLCNESYQFQLDQIERYLHIKAHNRKLLGQNGIPTVALYSSHTFDGINNINNYYLQGNNHHSNFANGSGNISQRYLYPVYQILASLGRRTPQDPEGRFFFPIPRPRCIMRVTNSTPFPKGDTYEA